jgi:transglutaminase-like putative cysteine protease
MSQRSWRLRVRHKTGFTYAGPVGSSFNEARMSPRNEQHQAVLDARVEVWPPARTYRYEDYWGTIVTSFDVQVPHESLDVTATATVETLSAAGGGGGAGGGAGPADAGRTSAGRASAGWVDLAVRETADRWYELLLHTPRTALDEELTQLAAEWRAEHRMPHAAALVACERIRAEVAYEPGTTGVQTDAVHAWRQRSGVCQDISHLAAGLLRAMGIPARYVSGYLHPDSGATIGEPTIGQSHAWVEWWAGEWVGFDPTNGIPVGERHVVVGRGRDYADVPPLKGVFSGAPHVGQRVEVELTRLR